MNKYKISVGEVKKLEPSSDKKDKYVLHYRNVQLYIQLGMKLKKNNRVSIFRQFQRVKPSIDFNTEKRKQGCNSFEKDVFKLTTNIVHGKTLKNLSNRVDIRFATYDKHYQKK